MNVTGLLIAANVLVVGLPILDVISWRLTGGWFVGVRAGWICFTIGAFLLTIGSAATGFWVGAVLDAVGTALGVRKVRQHWHDDDDDWPGPRKLTEWAKRKLARRPVPVPVPR